MSEEDDDEDTWVSLGLGADLLRKEESAGAGFSLFSLKCILADPSSRVRSAIQSGGALPALEASLQKLFYDAESNVVDAYLRERDELKEVDEKARIYEGELQRAEQEMSALIDRLGDMTSEVRRLQKESDGILEANKEKEKTEVCLEAYVNAVVLSPALVRHIVDGDVGSQEYGVYLRELQKKIAFFELDDAKKAASYEDIKPILGRLTLKAVRKVQRFLLQKIALLRVPNTNVQIIKETVLLKHRALVEFIQDNSPRRFKELRNVYVESMSRLYFVLFKKYVSGLLALKEDAQSGVLPIADDSAANRSSGMTSGPYSLRIFLGGRSMLDDGSPPNTKTTKSFTVPSFEARVQSLRNINAPAIVLAVAEANREKFFYEEIHRSIGKMLTDTCTTEHRFCAHFFGDTYGRMFDVLFKRVVDLLLESVSRHISGTSDAVGTLLALKINESQRTAMQKRNISDLCDYFIRVDVLLKPRFKLLFDANVDSLRKAHKNVRSFFGGEGSTTPHVITRRFSQLSSSVLVLSTYGATDETISESCKRLRIELSNFLASLSAHFVQPRSRFVFLINNLDLILGTYGSRNLLSTEDYSYFSSLLTMHMAAYVELELSTHFPDLQGILRAEKRSKTASVPPTDRVRAILREFARNWHLAVSHMKDGIRRMFPNFNLGEDVLRAVLAGLIALHKRVESLINIRYSALKTELVPQDVLAREIKRLQQSST